MGLYKQLIWGKLGDRDRERETESDFPPGQIRDK